jgi:arginine deiminase
MSLCVESEIGRLRRVLVHRPGGEIDRMIPAMMEELLFDDILFGEAARAEHLRFTAVLEAAGAEVLDAEVLLAEVLAEEAPRRALLECLETEYGEPPELTPQLAAMEAAELARVLIAGLPVGTVPQGRRRRFYDLSPVPNYFFQRDPQVVIGGHVMISSMATDAREREPLLAQTLFRHHPALSGHASLFAIEHPPHLAPDFDPAFSYPTLEGGDVLVPFADTVLVGISERSNRRGAEILAERLGRSSTAFRHLILVELPKNRSYMHLDTVFTFVDRGTCLAYEPVIQPGHHQSCHAYYADLQRDELSFSMRRSLPDALAAIGHPVDIVPCGGGGDLVDQAREQWTDGANAFAVAPGVILLYRRNRRTVEELGARGWRVLSDEDVLERGEPVVGRGPTVVVLPDNELSRARGGPRCMTMPLERDSL